MPGEPCPEIAIELEEWSAARGIDFLFWTALPPKFDGRVGAEPTLEEAINYLGSLEGIVRELAESYVRKAPAQIDTNYRREFERVLGWMRQ
jgi:hypothetical protein